MKSYLLIKEVSRKMGVPVGTLLYYDQLGLLKPKMRSESGYRLYTPEDLERLSHILLLKGLGFKIAEIKKVLDNNIPIDKMIFSLSNQLKLLQSQNLKIKLAEDTLALAIAECAKNRNFNWSYLCEQNHFSVKCSAKAEIRWAWWEREGLAPSDQVAFDDCVAQLENIFNVDEMRYQYVFTNLLLEIEKHIKKAPESEKGKDLGSRTAGLLYMMYGENRKLAWAVYRARRQRDDLEQGHCKKLLDALLKWLETSLIFHNFYPPPDVSP